MPQLNTWGIDGGGLLVCNDCQGKWKGADKLFLLYE